MSKYLFIVESPGKISKIQSFLGGDYKVVASVGHIRQIPKKGLGIDIENGFEPEYEVTPDKKDVVSKIKEEAKKAEIIYLATDPDREGEGISVHIKAVLNKEDQKKCKRVTYKEITKKAVTDAIKNSRDIDNNLADAQKARQVLDRLIGYKISPLLWSDVADKTSAGRVQSIALKIISEREKDIINFKEEKFWYIDAKLKCKDGSFNARVVTTDKDNRFFKDEECVKVFDKLKDSDYFIESAEKEEKEVKPNPPFDTASLQTTASSVFGWPAKKTSKIAQSLYEKGCCTYIRTDSFSISDDALKEVRSYISENHECKYLSAKENVYKKKEASGSQEAHECIRPTHCEDVGDELAGDDLKLYSLIRDRFIACQMSPAKANLVTYVVGTNTDEKYKLIAKGKSIGFDGWMKVYKYNNAKDEILPNASKGESLLLKDLDKSEHETQPPPRYNDGSLVKKMEKDGVGRPSTYASIIENIKERGYVVEVKKGALQSTELGLKVYEYLQGKFNDFIMDIGFTAELENDLDIIGDGTKKYLDVVSKTYDFMMTKIGGPNGSRKKSYGAGVSTGCTCTECDKGSIVKKNGKFGEFYCCSLYPECKSVFVKDGESFKLKQANNSVNTGASCPDCEKKKQKGTIVERKGSYGVFYACNNYPKCKSVFKKNDDGTFSKK